MTDSVTLNTDEQQAKWIAHGDKLLQLAGAIYSEADLIDANSGAADPKVVALALLCRTVGNFRGAVSMVEQGLIVEARTLVRSCVENLIWIDALAKGGAKFVQEMAENEHKSRESRGQVLAQWAGTQAIEPPFAKDLHAFLKGLKGKPKSLLNVKTTAQTGLLKDSYIIYGQLSSDSAHPSMDALSRHVQRNSDNSITIVADGLTDDSEALQTLEFASSMLLGVCVGANQIIGGVPSGATLEPIFQEFIVLRTAQAAIVNS